MRLLLVFLLVPSICLAEWRDVGPKEEAQLLQMQAQLDEIEHNQREAQVREEGRERREKEFHNEWEAEKNQREIDRSMDELDCLQHRKAFQSVSDCL